MADIELLESQIKESILKVLDDVEEQNATDIAAFLTSAMVGVKKLEQLKFVTTDDLSTHLEPIPARELVAFWKAQYSRNRSYFTGKFVVVSSLSHSNLFFSLSSS